MNDVGLVERFTQSHPRSFDLQLDDKIFIHSSLFYLCSVPFHFRVKIGKIVILTKNLISATSSIALLISSRLPESVHTAKPLFRYSRSAPALGNVGVSLCRKTNITEDGCERKLYVDTAPPASTIVEAANSQS